MRPDANPNTFFSSNPETPKNPRLARFMTVTVKNWTTKDLDPEEFAANLANEQFCYQDGHSMMKLLKKYCREVIREIDAELPLYAEDPATVKAAKAAITKDIKDYAYQVIAAIQPEILIWRNYIDCGPKDQVTLKSVESTGKTILSKIDGQNELTPAEKTNAAQMVITINRLFGHLPGKKFENDVKHPPERSSRFKM